MDDAAVADRKRELRRAMRVLRRALPDQADRSRRIWETVRSLAVVERARVVMIFASVNGEPDTAAVIEWCRSNGKTVVLPEDDPPPDPKIVDVVIVPGTAFTVEGHRLGQGGGWYDRFLPQLRADAITIGVAFAPQLIDTLPVEPHDVPLDVVVTDAGVATQMSS